MLHRDGDDGRWSTFAVQVGTPGQTVRLLPGTSASAGSSIWVIISEGCVDVNPRLPSCADERGYLFQSNHSTSWTTRSIQNGVDGAIYSLVTLEESILGLAGNGSYGFDTVSLGLPGSGLPTLNNQVIAGIWTNDFFLGSLGLSAVPFNFSSLDDPQPSILATLRNQSLIPSASWAYTAGAQYKNPPVFGSLTLGGFDTTRFRQNNLTLPFGADFSRDLLVSLQSVTYDTIGSFPLLASSIDIFIDSLVTEIWLPFDVCEAFAQQFNLTWNTQGQLYMVEDAVHTALVAQNPTFTLTIGQAGGGGDTVEIVLPYAAFDLNLTAPIVGNTTRYFPLKQAQNSSQYTLGRVFLQEAYVITDYERRTFSISQALFPSTSVAQNLVAIDSPSDNSKKTRGGLSIGEIAGIVVAVFVASKTVIVIVVLCNRRQKRKKQATDTSTSHDEKPMQVDSCEVYELDDQSPRQTELPAFQGPWGRHELVTENRVYETDGREVVPVKNEAS